MDQLVIMVAGVWRGAAGVGALSEVGAATMDRNNHSLCVMTAILIFFLYLTVSFFYYTFLSFFFFSSKSLPPILPKRFCYRLTLAGDVVVTASVRHSG